MNHPKSIILIGASAGGLQAISNLLQNVSKDMDAAIFIVLHVSHNSLGNILVQHLQKHTSFICQIPENGEPIQTGHVYLAPPDFHMLLIPGFIRLVKGAHQNRWRPSIDVLFRSAAVAYNSQVTGIILSGMLDDGTSGMCAIKRCGGISMVQEPDEAEFSAMPTNVLNHVEVDYRVPISDIGYILADMNSKPDKPKVEVPEDIRIEVELTEKMVSSIEELKKIGIQSNYTCPDCGGSLFVLKNDPVQRYRCFTGHVYTEKLLHDKQTEALEDSLWATIRRMEERKSLFQSLAKPLHESNYSEIETETENLTKAEEMEKYIATLKELLVSLGKNGSNNNGYE